MVRIVLVDDDLVNRRIVSHVLGKAGYEVVTAPDGQAGLDLILETLPDLAILDVSMPVMDGVTVFKRLRADERSANIPVIILTGSADEMIDFRRVNLHPDGFLTKPASSHSILQMIARLAAREISG